MTPKLRFPEFTDNWQTKRLGDIGRVAMCKRIFNSETNADKGVPFYKIGTFGKNPDAYISQEQYDKYKSKFSFPAPGDILLSASGTIGRMVIYDGEPAYFQDSNIIWLKHDGKLALNSFLKQVYPRIKWITESGTIKRLYNDNFLKTKIITPKTEEQQKIADFLSLVDERLSLAEAKLELLKKYKKSLMQKIFSQKLRFKDENGNNYPKWKEKSFDKVLYSESTKKYQIKNSEFNKTGRIPVVDQSPDLISGYSDSDEKTFDKIPQIVFGDHTTEIKFVDFKFIIGADGTKLLNNVSQDDVLKYVYYFLSLNRPNQEGYKRHFSILKRINIILPHTEEQQRISDFLSLIDDKISLEQKKLEQAKQYKKGLLQRMFV